MRQQRGMERIADLYRRIEQMQLRTMQGAVAAVSAATAVESAVRMANECTARFECDALAEGYLEGRAIAKLAEVVGRRNLRSAFAQRERAEAAYEATRSIYMEARTKSEQFAAVLKRSAALAKAELRRSEQIAMDDRFAAGFRERAK
jgi:hypothetical protein